MVRAELFRKIDDYLENNWEAMLGDIETLVRIPSIEEQDKKTEGAPFGPGPKKALTAALKIASDMGFHTFDDNGYIGFADLVGESRTQIGIIGHMDVVPAGPGWTYDPYGLTRKDGYVLGRGVLDDKGPSVMALHAMKFWKDENITLPYTIRFLFGANEESGMADVSYYRKHYKDPAFLFTPDAEFPVCYGEKGIFRGAVSSKSIRECERVIVEFEGGAATNAVPGTACAVVRAHACNLLASDGIMLRDVGEGLVCLEATGKSAHAAMPDDGINAIGLLVGYLLKCGLCSAQERDFLEFNQKILSNTDGSGIGIKSHDANFGALTLVGGTIKIENDCFVQTFDIRFPPSITVDEIKACLHRGVVESGGVLKDISVSKPFVVEPNNPAIQALLDAYNEVTGETARPFTMGGATYAREFKSAASFGPEKPWIKNPTWVGSMHGQNEGVSEELLKESFKIYVFALDNLMRIDLE